jgi:dipeptidase E
VRLASCTECGATCPRSGSETGRLGSGGSWERTVEAAVIANAVDADPTLVRQARWRASSRRSRHSALGLRPEELDLHTFFDRPDAIEASLEGYGLVWLRGGNVFVLRHALNRSGADGALRRLLRRDALVYGGYSAGPCVLGPTIRGFAATDDPTVVTEVYGADPMWTGMGIVYFVVVPHVDSPGHPESARLSDLAATFRANGVRHQSLRDGEVLIIDGENVAVR